MTLKLNGTTSGSVSLDAPATGSDISFTLPGSVGTNGQLLSTDGAGVLSFVNGGKILQVVRATDATSRTTTSTTFVDVTGMSVTITPQKTTSAIMIIATFYAETTWTSDGERRASYRLTDSSNNTISGVQEIVVSLLNISGTGGTRSWNAGQVAIGYATPNTTSATTYKLRFRIEAAGTTFGVRNDVSTGQMFAIEVAA